MRRKGLKRLELWLPETHFIWGAPPGCRATLARSYLNLAPALEAQGEMLREALSRLARLEERLAALEARLGAGGPTSGGQGGGGTKKPDAKSFLAAF